MTKGPSAHLSWSELACHDGTPYPEKWRTSRAVPLAREFEKIRNLVGGPIRIGSAYRTVVHNRKIGGAPQSQHVEGRALDLYPPDGVTVDELYRLVRVIAKDDSSAINGVGHYPTFVHFDIRPARADGKLTVWYGSRAWAELR